MSTGGAPKFNSRSAQESLLYIQEKVNPILEALVTAVLLERPEDPAFFMLNWLCEQNKDLVAAEGQRSSSNAEELAQIRSEITKLQERKAHLLAVHGARIGTVTAAKSAIPVDLKSMGSTKTDEDDEDDDDDDGPDDMEPPANFNRGQRQSVSAEAYGAWNVRAEFEPPVYEKSSEQKARIMKFLEPSFLFNSLDLEDLNTIVLSFKERHADATERIIQAGDDGGSMYLIAEGCVNCIKEVDGEDTVVKVCVAGDVFGELALLYNCPRAASVEAVERTTLWELDRGTFNRIVKDAAAKKRDTYLEFLKKVPLLSNIDTYELMTIADALKVNCFAKEGELIIKQGDAGDRFFIVLEGAVEARKAHVFGQDPQKVMEHNVGDYFGELALLKNEPRAASVYTAAPLVKLVSMDRKTFKRLLGPVEDILRRQAMRYDWQQAAASAAGCTQQLPAV